MVKKICHVLAGCSTLALATVPLSALAAQEQNSQAVDGGGQAAESAEIIVTARKTDERLEDVPSSISVLTGEDAELLALDGIADYVRQIPNATLVASGPEYLSDISIRGQGGGRQGFSESATGIYRNGIYVAGGGFGGRSFNRLDFFDVQAIETYRGPQGALYGRNAVGGAVNVVSNRPTDEFSSKFKIGYTDVERFEVSGVANLPIGDQVAARFGAFYVDRADGFIDNVHTGEAVDLQEYYGFRGGLRFDIGSATTLNLTAEYYDSTAPAFGALGQKLEPNLVALPPALGGPQSSDVDPGPFESAETRQGVVKIDEFTLFAELESDLGFGDLTAIVTHKTRNGERSNEDLDMFLGFQGIDVGGIETDLIQTQTEDFDRYGAEIRIASKPESAVRWMVGADFQTFEDIVTTVNGGTSGLGGLASLATRDEGFTEDLTSFSGFGLVGFDLSDALSLTLEARLQNDKKDFFFVREQGGATVIDTGVLEQSSTRFLPAATLEYELDSGQLVYLRGSSGYRPGGFNTGLEAADVDLIPYDPETAYSIEVGYKGRTAGGTRFGVTAYYMMTNDVQAVSTLSETNTTVALLNVGDTTLYGLEAEIGGNAKVGNGAVRWSISAATSDGEFSDDATVRTAGATGTVELVDLSGARVNRTRDLIFSASAFYFAPISNSVDMFFGGSVQAETGGFENATGDTDSATGRSLEGFFIADARAGISRDSWRLSVFGKNLFNKVYLVQNVLGNGFYNEPRVFGVELGVTF